MLVSVCVCASFMWVTPPCLMAPCCVQRPALSCSLLSHSHKQMWWRSGGNFGVSLTLIPSTIHRCCICCSSSHTWKLFGELQACLCSLLGRLCPLSSPQLSPLSLFLVAFYFNPTSKLGCFFFQFFFLILRWLGLDLSGYLMGDRGTDLTLCRPSSGKQPSVSSGDQVSLCRDTIVTACFAIGLCHFHFFNDIFLFVCQIHLFLDRNIVNK